MKNHGILVLRVFWSYACVCSRAGRTIAGVLSVLYFLNGGVGACSCWAGASAVVELMREFDLKRPCSCPLPLAVD